MFRRLRLWFAYGLVVWIPIAVCVLALKLLYGIVHGLWALVPAGWRLGRLVHADVPGLSVLGVLVLVFLTGVLVRNVVGERLVRGFEKLIGRVPFLRVVYGASKQIASSLFVGRHRAFEEAVLVPYPKAGSYAIGFVTSRRALHAESAGEELLSVYVPSTPNPTSGFLLMLPRRELRPLDLSVEEAFRTLLTLGMTNLFDDPALGAATTEKVSPAGSG